MDEPGAGIYSVYWLTGLGGVFALVTGRAQSLISRLLSVGFILLAGASVWWIVEWFDRECPDQLPQGPSCEELETPVIFWIWLGLVIATAGVLIRERLKSTA